MGFLLHSPLSGHSTAWCKGPVASPCSPYFSFFSTPSLALAQHTNSPAASHPFLLDSRSALEPHSHWPFTRPFSSVTRPGLSHHGAEPSVLSLMLLHPSFEVRTPPTQEKSRCQVRQKCPHDLGSQEGPGRTRHSALWPDSYCKTHKDQQTSTDCLISMEPVFSGVRTALSMIPLFFNHL